MMHIDEVRSFPIPGKWTVHGYYSLNPYAPDGSGRILCAGCDYETGIGEVFVLDADGHILDRFGKQRVSTIFYHTGFWQAWGENAETVYYQAADGDVLHPRVAAHDLKTGKEWIIDADMEGAPITGEPLLYGLSGIYYAAGYADRTYHPEWSPVPFAERDRHGLFRCFPKTGKNELVLSINDVLAVHPLRDQLMEAEARVLRETGTPLTLMIYCARYNREGSRIMFHFGNHCTDKRRNEGHLLSLFTAEVARDGAVSNIQHALDLNFARNGVHWSWMNRDTLIGYAGENYGLGKSALCSVRYDGSDFRVLSRNPFTGGHPSVSPADPRIAVTDGAWEGQGRILFLNTETGEEITECFHDRVNHADGKIPGGRNRYFVCHHPVFNADGSRMLFNTMRDGNATLCEMKLSYTDK